MQRISQRVTSFFAVLACAFLTMAAVAQVQAQEKANPTGTWTWTMAGRNGGPDRVMKLKLKAEGEKLTGTLISPGRDGGESVQTKIDNGKVNGDQISFSITREFNGNSFTQKYSGKVSADTIKGKSEFERNGNTRSRDWEAKRTTDSK